MLTAICMFAYVWPQNYSWPTPGGISLDVATRWCQAVLTLSAAGSACSSILGADVIDLSLQACVEDIKVPDITVFSFVDRFY